MRRSPHLRTCRTTRRGSSRPRPSRRGRRRSAPPSSARRRRDRTSRCRACPAGSAGRTRPGRTGTLPSPDFPSRSRRAPVQRARRPDPVARRRPPDRRCGGCHTWRTASQGTAHRELVTRRVRPRSRSARWVVHRGSDGHGLDDRRTGVSRHDALDGESGTSAATRRSRPLSRSAPPAMTSMCRSTHLPKSGASPGASMNSRTSSLPWSGMARRSCAQDGQAARVVPVVEDLGEHVGVGAGRERVGEEVTADGPAAIGDAGRGEVRARRRRRRAAGRTGSPTRPGDRAGSPRGCCRGRRRCRRSWRTGRSRRRRARPRLVCADKPVIAAFERSRRPRGGPRGTRTPASRTRARTPARRCGRCTSARPTRGTAPRCT